MYLAGIVLCGGLSRRMGRPKALLPFGGEPLLLRALRRLGEALFAIQPNRAPAFLRAPTEGWAKESGRGPDEGEARSTAHEISYSNSHPLIVVAAHGQDLPPLPAAITLTHDRHPGRGPLEGLAVGLAALPAGIDAVFVTSCDTPFLQPGFVQRVVSLLGDQAAAAPRIDGRWHPLAAVYRPSVLPAVESLLSSGHARASDLLEAVCARPIAREELADVDPDLASLLNLNRPEEYESALRLSESIPPVPGGKRQG